MTPAGPTRRAMLALAAFPAPSGDTGGLEGLVTGEDGSAIENATVKAQHRVRGATSGAATDGKGMYRFAALPGGAYSLYVAKAGYCSVWIRQVVVRPAQTARHDVTLARDANCRTGRR